MSVCSFCGEAPPWLIELDDGRYICTACEPCEFFERFLSLTGDFAGRPFKLMPWTRQVLRDVFGTLDDEGERQYKDVYLEMPKGSAKSAFCAGLVVFSLYTARSAGTEIYSAATAKDQAGILYRAAAQMVHASPKLSKRLRCVPSTKRIVRVDDDTSFYGALSADGDIHDGVNPSLVIRDELHRWRTRKALELNQILERGTIKRERSLLIDITTAGEEDESPLCWQRHEYARQVNEGIFEDPRFYGRIWAADEARALAESDPEYWKSREARVRANPSHEDNGGYLKDSVLADLCLKAQNDPKEKAEYLRYHLNVWGQKFDRAIDIAGWRECDGGIHISNWPEYSGEAIERNLVTKWGLADQPCYAGVDASWTIDLTAVALIFPPKNADDPWSILSFFWMPAGRVAERERKDRVPYSEWVRRGFIDATAGNSIDLRAIMERLRWARKTFELREVDYDPYTFRTTANDLSEEGFQCVEISQNYRMLSHPTKWLLSAYLDKAIRHGNHPF